MHYIEAQHQMAIKVLNGLLLGSFHVTIFIYSQWIELVPLYLTGK